MLPMFGDIMWKGKRLVGGGAVCNLDRVILTEKVTFV